MSTKQETPHERCARCRGELTAWTMARGAVLFCGWFCWHAAARESDPIGAEVERATG
jgi:hypothetical protein